MDQKLRFFMFVVSIARFVSSLTKCCPSQYELFSPNASHVVARQRVQCVPSVGSTLAVSRPLADLNFGLPNCSQLSFVQVYDKSQIHCVDRVSQLNTIFGVRCFELSTSLPTFLMPAVLNLRKCCPHNRKYDVEKAFCWNHLADNYTNALNDVLKLTSKEKNVLVNVTYGAPKCLRSDVLLDKVGHYQKFRFTQGDGVYDDSGLLLSFDEYCVDVVDDLFEYLVVRSCRDQRTVCGEDHVCVRKCCPDGYEVKRKNCTLSTSTLSLDFHKGTRLVANVKPLFLQGEKCNDGKYKVSSDQLEEYVLEVDGKVHVRSTNATLGFDQYCVDTIDRMQGTHMFVCFAEEWQRPRVQFELRVTVNAVCAAISAFFLLLTFIIYAILPSLRNAHCRLIMCYLLTSMFSYILVVLQGMLPHVLDLSPTFCMILGYSMLFTFLSSFGWLNIISFDIWSTFRAVESSFFKKSKTSKRFSLCCLYGWGFAASWTALAVFCQLTSNTDTPSILKPDIGQLSCWFSNYGLSRIPFFIVPVSVMITFNIVMFVVTVKYCAHIKSELQRSHNRNNNYTIKKYAADVNEFMINIKLFILMGLNWTMELISLMVQPENRTFFLLSDIVNALEGIIIFCLFVLKRKVLSDLKSTFFGDYHMKDSRDRAATFTTSTSSSIVPSMMTTRSINTTP